MAEQPLAFFDGSYVRGDCLPALRGPSWHQLDGFHACEFLYSFIQLAASL